MDDLTFRDPLTRILKLGEDRVERVRPVVGNADDHESDLEFSKVVLLFQIAVYGHENVESRLGENEKGIVLSCSPPCFRYGLNGMSRERVLQARRYALI